MKISCPYCNQHYDVENNHIGMNLSCIICQETFVIQEDLIIQEQNEDDSLNIENNDTKTSQKISPILNNYSVLAKNNDLKDFINFRILLAPKIMKWTWIIGTVLCLLAGMIFCVINIMQNNLVLAIISIIAGLVIPYVLRLILEFIMVPFSILDTLVEINNKKNM